MNKKHITRKIWNVLEELGQSFGAYMQAKRHRSFFSVKCEHLILPYEFLWKKNLNFPSISQKIWPVSNLTIWYFLPKLIWPTVWKNCSSDRKNKLLKFKAEGQDFQIVEITRTICSNGERSEHFLVTECSFNLLQEVSHIYLIK